MAITKQKTLDNGETIKYSVISVYTVDIIAQKIFIKLDCFKSKSYYNQAIKRQTLQAEQIELVNQMSEDSDVDDTKFNETDSKLADKINKLADKINELEDYDSYVLGTMNVEISYTEDLTIDNLESKILETDLFDK